MGGSDELQGMQDTCGGNNLRRFACSWHKIALDKANTFGRLVRYPLGVISQNLQTQFRRVSFESSLNFNTVIVSKMN